VLYILSFSILESRWDVRFLNLFFSCFHHELHFYVSVLFPETYVHADTFSIHFSHVHVLIQRSVGLCATVTETNHAHSPIRQPYKFSNFIILRQFILRKNRAMYKRRDSPVGIATRLLAERQGFQDSSHGGGWGFFSLPPRSERLWGPPSLLFNGY